MAIFRVLFMFFDGTNAARRKPRDLPLDGVVIAFPNTLNRRWASKASALKMDRYFPA
jgi:hypothetical protein